MEFGICTYRATIYVSSGDVYLTRGWTVESAGAKPLLNPGSFWTAPLQNTPFRAGKAYNQLVGTVCERWARLGVGRKRL